MSVCLLSENELTVVSNTLTTNTRVQELVSKTQFFADRNKYAKESEETFIARAIWYGYIANITAYNVQYQENNPINFKIEETEEKVELKEAISILGSLVYNCYTNDGNSFLAKEWMDVLEMINKIK